jgi:hypothetical protein
MQKVNWQANWIWRRDGGNINEFLYFRKKFSLADAVKSAQCLISAESWYRLYINGVLVHHCTSISYPDQQVYDRLDIGRYLKRGANVVAVLVNYFGIPSGWSMPKQAGLLVQLEIVDRRGNKQVVATDQSWKNAPALEWESDVPRRSFWLNLEFVERRDFRQQPAGWNAVAFDDSAWAYSYKLRGAPYGEWGQLEERDIKQLVRTPLPVKAVRCALVRDLVPTHADLQPAFLFKIREVFKPDQKEPLVMRTWVKSDKKQRGRILVETKAACTFLDDQGRGTNLNGNGEIKCIDVDLRTGMNVLRLATVSPFKDNLCFTIVPLSAGEKLEFFADPYGRRAGWEIKAGQKTLYCDNRLKLHQGFNAAKLMWQEEIVKDLPLGRGVSGQLPALPVGKSYAITFDVGKEVTGYPVVDIQAPAGTVLDVGGAEDLTNGRVNAAYSSVYYTDRSMLDNTSRRVEPFEWKGLRYFQVNIRNARQPIKLNDVSFDFLGYPFRETGSFHCSDPLLERIWKVGAYTARLCMLDTPIDCPWREKRQWIGDGGHIMDVNYYAFGDYRYARHALRQQAFFQDPDGRMFVCLPLREEYPMQTMDWVLAQWDYYVHSGDKTLLAELLPRTERVVDNLLKSVSTKGIYCNQVPGTLMWIDNTNFGAYSAGNKYAYFPLNAKLIQTLITAGKIVTLSGKTGVAGIWKQRAGQLCAAVRREFWDNRAGLFRDLDRSFKGQDRHAELSNGLALVFGIATPAMARSIIKKMFIENRRGVEASPYGKYFVYKGLLRYRRKEQVLDEVRARWGYMLGEGATSFWEGFEKGRSRCHGWAGYPAVIFSQEILGVKPVENGRGGFAEVTIKPQCFDLTWARGTVPTPHGPIRVEWEAKGGKIKKLKFKVPRGVKVVRGK